MEHSPRAELVIRVTIACGVLETVAVFLRLIARSRSRASFAADDWWIVATLIPSYAMLATGILMVTIGGGGRHIATLKEEQIPIFLKTVAAAILTYSLTILMVKISILLLYRRIFNTSAFRKMSLAVGAACVGWAIAAILCLIFQCNPISGLWNPAYTFTDKCINLQAYYRGISGAHMGLDIILLAMPIYMVWNLRLDASQKLIVSGIFMLGSLVCLASLMRIITANLIKSADITYSLTTPYIWSQIEPTMAVICACLITYRPLVAGLNLNILSSLGWSKRSPSSSRLQEQSSDITPSGCNSERPTAWSKGRGPSDWELLSIEDRNNDATKGRVHVAHISLSQSSATPGTLDECGSSRGWSREEDGFV